jgi:hypothetical protein
LVRHNFAAVVNTTLVVDGVQGRSRATYRSEKTIDLERAYCFAELA